MTHHSTPIPGQLAPLITAKNHQDNAFALPATPDNRMTAVFFYRGIHCPICKKQIEELARRQGEFRELGVDVAAISMDDRERFDRQQQEWDLGDLHIGHDLTEESAREWGLFISDKEKDAEPARFAEPGIAILYPDGRIYAMYLQNVPFARPTTDDLLSGLKFILDNGYPIRGTA